MAKGVCQRMLRVFQVQKLYINVSWGSVVWNSLESNIFKYDSTLGVRNALTVSPFLIKEITIQSMHANIHTNEVNELWILLSKAML